MEEETKLFELIIDGELEMEGVNAISFVDHPAIERNWMAFNKEYPTEYKFIEEEDKFLVTGPCMIPNQKIRRIDDLGREFFVFFSRETIAKCNELFFKRNQHNQSNVNHSPFMIDGVTAVESWLIVDSSNDKANAMGFNDFEVGTWMVTFKVSNKALWQAIKAGEVKGFSIEGFFIEQAVSMGYEKRYDEVQLLFENTELTTDELYEALKKIIHKS